MWTVYVHSIKSYVYLSNISEINRLWLTLKFKMLRNFSILI